MHACAGIDTMAITQKYSQNGKSEEEEKKRLYECAYDDFDQFP